MSVNLSQFGLVEVLRCATGFRSALRDAPTMETAATRACRFLYDELVGPDHTRACALVRCYKTHAYNGLDADVQRFANGFLEPSTRPRPEMKCLTLLATVGDEPAWNDRRASRGHLAIPLLSPQMIESAPMVAQLIRQFGLQLTDVVQPSPNVMRDLEGKTYGVFHIQDAQGSPYIPAQKEFVEPHRISSVVGFGGSLKSGDLFAIILFSRVPIDVAAAERFRSLALDVKAHFFRFDALHIFDPTARANLSASPSESR